MRIIKEINLNELEKFDYSDLYLKSSLCYEEELYNLKGYLTLLKEEIQVYVKEDINITIDMDFVSILSLKIITDIMIFPVNHKINENKKYESEILIDINKLKTTPLIEYFNDTFFNNSVHFSDINLMRDYLYVIGKIDCMFNMSFNIREKLDTMKIFNKKEQEFSKELFKVSFSGSFFSLSSNALDNVEPFFKIKYLTNDRKFVIKVKQSFITLDLYEFLSVLNEDIEQTIFNILKCHKININSMDEFRQFLFNKEVLNY